MGVDVFKEKGRRKRNNGNKKAIKIKMSYHGNARETLMQQSQTQCVILENELIYFPNL